MAYDLIWGSTPRDWSCGSRLVDASQPWSGQPPAPRLAELARGEITRTSALAIKLRRAGQLPDADWRDYGALHKRWVAFSDQHRGNFREGDTLALWNFRKLNEKFTRKLVALSRLASPKDLATTTPATTTPATPRPGEGGKWYLLLGAALTVAGFGIFSAAKKQPSEG